MTWQCDRWDAEKAEGKIENALIFSIGLAANENKSENWETGSMLHTYPHFFAVVFRSCKHKRGNWPSRILGTMLCNSQIFRPNCSTFL